MPPHLIRWHAGPARPERGGPGVAADYRRPKKCRGEFGAKPIRG